MIQSICCTPVHKFTLTASTKCLPCSYFCVIPLLAQFTQSIVVNINSPEVCHSMSELSSSVSSSSSQINTAYMSESRVFIWASHLKRNSCFYHKRAVWSSMDLLLLLHTHKKTTITTSTSLQVNHTGSCLLNIVVGAFRINKVI